MKKMYPAVVNSPKTELPESITSTQTDITVANVAVLLTGEGIATIGNGDTAETITYTSVDGNVLKGCIRGYQGVARSWTAGTRVARNFAAADWDAARDNITELAERLEAPDRASITLQPGISVVQASQDAAFKLAGLQGRTVLNYQSQIGIYGVLNPYVIRYGENLIPPFYEWSQLGTDAKIVSPYELSVNTTNAGGSYSYVNIPCFPATQYYLKVDIVGTHVAVETFDSAGISIATRYLNEGVVATEANARTVRVTIYRVDAGTLIAKSPMLKIGSTALPFKPREDSMLALQTDLHANPDTGANPDSVFEREGQYFKLAKWRKVSYGSNEAWTFGSNKTGYKQVVLAAANRIGYTPEKTTLIKYNGNSLSINGQASATDTYAVDSNGQIYITISNTDSGWGDSYSPTAEEIKAYFMGWVMSQQESWSTEPSRYNGTGTKGWFRRYTGTGSPVNTSQLGIIDGSSGTTTLPTTPASNWTPYQLLYQLATPVVEPITSEGQMTFIDGDNQVEVGTGIVLMENVKPGYYSGSNDYMINDTAYNSALKYKVDKIFGVYRNGGKEYRAIMYSGGNQYGNQKARINANDYDLSAVYSVTYLMLDKYPAVDINGTYAQNEKALLLDAVKTLQENTTRISVLESKKAEKDSPAWIEPTLLNNWINYGDGQDRAAYLKDSNGFVHIRGIVKLGVAAAMVFKLPVGYRPKATLRVPISGTIKFGEMTIGVDGGIYFNSGIDGTYVSMHIPPFAAEQ